VRAAPESSALDGHAMASLGWTVVLFGGKGAGSTHGVGGRPDCGFRHALALVDERRLAEQVVQRRVVEQDDLRRCHRAPPTPRR
jgi:hypothetical protein